MVVAAAVVDGTNCKTRSVVKAAAVAAVNQEEASLPRAFGIPTQRKFLLTVLATLHTFIFTLVREYTDG